MSKENKYCYKNDGKLHCHVFVDGIYSHFETDGIEQKEQSYMTEKWKKNKLKEDGSQEWLKTAGFIKSNNL